jgi:hypothetical protein
MVGATGFEPATSWSQTKRSTKLSYAPIATTPNPVTVGVNYGCGLRGGKKIRQAFF